MPQGPEYLFFIQTSDHRFWGRDAAGRIEPSVDPYPLQFSPDGWQGMSVKNVRNPRYWGLDRSVTVPLSFVEDGAEIVKFIFITQGPEAPVFLSIAKQELDYEAGIGYQFWHRLIYRGEIDLWTYNHAGAKVSCNLLEDGLPKYLRANDNTAYEFPMDAPGTVLVEMDGIKLRERINYRDLAGFEVALSQIGTNFFGPLEEINREGDSFAIAAKSQDLQDVAGLTFAQKLASDNWLFTNQNDTPLTIRLFGTLRFTCTKLVSSPAYGLRFRFLTSTQTISNQNAYQIYQVNGLALNQVYVAPFDISVTLQPGERLYREGIFFGGVGSEAAVTFADDSSLGVSFITRRPTTYIRAWRGEALFQQLIDRVTEKNFAGEAGGYLNTNRALHFTCGNAIRGFADAALKISFSDFFQFWDCFDAIGITQIGQFVRMGRKAALIDTGATIQLQNVGDIVMRMERRFSFNELEVGYPEIKNDVGALNGNEEFNCKFVFSTGATKAPAKLDRISKVKTSSYEIEKIRTTTQDKDTTDSKYDNDVYALYLNPVPVTRVIDGQSVEVYTLDRSINAGATGLIEPETIFNLQLSPKRSLLRMGDYLRSCGYLADGKVLRFISADKNSKLVAGGVVERADILIGDLSPAFFTPVVIEVTGPAPYTLLELLDGNPLRVVEFDFQGTTIRGVIEEVSSNPEDGKPQTFQLLVLPGTDLTKFITYTG